MILSLKTIIWWDTRWVVIFLIDFRRFKSLYSFSHFGPSFLQFIFWRLFYFLFMANSLIRRKDIIVKMRTKVPVDMIQNTLRPIWACMHVHIWIRWCRGSMTKHKCIVILVYFVLMLHYFELRFVKFWLLNRLRIQNLSSRFFLFYFK